MVNKTEMGLKPFGSIDNVGHEHFFWPNTIDILQTHNTSILRARSIRIAQAAPHINVDEFVDALNVHRNAVRFKKPRKLTGDNEENHALQVFLVTAEIIGIENITTETAQIAVGHNLFEDTKVPLRFKANSVNEGIRALSHKENGVPLYPDPTDKREHFTDIVAAHVKPDLTPFEILAVKLADQIVVGNDPLTRGELKDPTDDALFGKWEEMSKTKRQEMELLGQLVPAKEAGIHRRLREAIAFITLRQEPFVDSVENLVVVFGNKMDQEDKHIDV